MVISKIFFVFFALKIPMDRHRIYSKFIENLIPHSQKFPPAMRYNAFVKCLYSDYYSFVPVTAILPLQCPDPKAVDSSEILANFY